MMREEDDEETLFDQEGLLGSEKKSTWNWDWVRRIIKTLALSLAFFALGLCVSIPGATLLDLEGRTNASTEHISLIFSARSVGYLLGSVAGGVLFDYFDQQVLLFQTLVLTGFATVAVPWCTALTVLACMIGVQGVALGVLDTGGNMFCIQIWSKASPPYMQTLHFSFAVGAFLAPLLARPFLLGESANATVFPVVNTKIPHFPDQGFPGDTPHLTLGDDAWWLADAHHHRRVSRDAEVDSSWWLAEADHRRVLREAEGEAVNRTSSLSGVSALASADDLAGNVPATNSSPTANSTSPANSNSTAANSNSTSAANSTISTTRAPKPVVADAIHLTEGFANGDRARQHILEHKNDQRLETVHEGGASPEASTTVESPVEQSENGSLSGVNEFSDVNSSASDSMRNQTSGGNQSASDAQLSNSTVVVSPPAPETTSTTTTTTTTPKPSTTTTTTTTTTTSTTTTTTTTSTTPSTTTTSTTLAPEREKEGSTAVNSSSSGSVTTLSPTPSPTPSTTRKPKPQILDVLTSTLAAVEHMSKIQFAYLIIGLILLGDAVFFLVLYFRDCKAGTLMHQVTSLGPPSSPPTPACFRLSLLSLLFIFFLFYVGMEVTFGALVATFAVESPLVGWSQRQGATLAALFWGSMAAGRGLAILVARFFKPPCMLVADLVLMVAGAVALSLGLSWAPVVLWAGTLTLGLGMSSVFPTAVSWAQLYYRPLTGRATAVFIAGSGVGEMVIPVMTGYLFERVDSQWLMYMVLGLSLVVTLIFVGLQCLASRRSPPTSTSKLGFLPLHTTEEDEESHIAMDDMAKGSASSSSGGYKDSLKHQSTMVYNTVEDAEDESANLVDLSE